MFGFEILDSNGNSIRKLEFWRWSLAEYYRRILQNSTYLLTRILKRKYFLSTYFLHLRASKVSYGEEELSWRVGDGKWEIAKPFFVKTINGLWRSIWVKLIRRMIMIHPLFSSPNWLSSPRTLGKMCWNEKFLMRIFSTFLSFLFLWAIKMINWYGLQCAKGSILLNLAIMLWAKFVMCYLLAENQDWALIKHGLYIYGRTYEEFTYQVGSLIFYGCWSKNDYFALISFIPDLSMSILLVNGVAIKNLPFISSSFV